MRFPEHACAILLDHAGRFVLQLRPPHLVHAANQLTCFGGKCVENEDPIACLRRELDEETGWSPTEVLNSGLDLRCGQRWIARFYPVQLPRAVVIRPEPGFIEIRAAFATLAGLPLSPWHYAAIAGWRAGAHAVEV